MKKPADDESSSEDDSDEEEQQQPVKKTAPAAKKPGSFIYVFCMTWPVVCIVISALCKHYIFLEVELTVASGNPDSAPVFCYSLQVLMYQHFEYTG